MNFCFSHFCLFDKFLLCACQKAITEMSNKKKRKREREFKSPIMLFTITPDTGCATRRKGGEHINSFTLKRMVRFSNFHQANQWHAHRDIKKKKEREEKVFIVTTLSHGKMFAHL
jgi:hypothetical protein